MKKSEIVYFFKQNSSNYVKIGYTTKHDVSARFSCFNTYSPFGGSIIGIIKTESGITTEKQIHKELAHRRLKGEFFNISEDECKNIIERYNTNEINCIVSNFNIWLCSPLANIEALDYLIKKSIMPERDGKMQNQEIMDLILTHFNPDNRTVWLTATEIRDYILKLNPGLKINSMRLLGMTLIPIFGKSKSVREANTIRNRYFVGINAV